MLGVIPQPAMLLQLNVRVLGIGEDVSLSIGNSAWLMSYETALVLSAQMRRRARDAKLAAGDTSRQWSVKGTMHDAERGPDADQPFTPGKVYPVARERLKLAQVGARCEGTLVAVRFGSAEAKLPYQAAFTISQWIRMRAKDSKRRACDLARHWSSISAEAA